MPGIILTKDQKHELIPLRVKPHAHKSAPSITSNAFSRQAGAVLYGHYNMEYLLPNKDKLRLIANHNKKTVQLMLFTHSAQLIQRLPGERHSSLVANTISRLERYVLRCTHYSSPLTSEQKQKLNLTNNTINTLQKLLKKERTIEANDPYGQEQLRIEVLSIIERCRDANRLIANNPVVSEGSLGLILYDAYAAAQHYHFNRQFSVSEQDQMDFADVQTSNDTLSQPCYVWDSEIHIGNSEYDIDDALRSICLYYNLNPATQLLNVPANRFKKLEAFFNKLWLDGNDWVDYLASPKKPLYQTTAPKQRKDGVTVTHIDPYYKLHGLGQKAYKSINELAASFINKRLEPVYADSVEEALFNLKKDHWALIENENTIIYRRKNEFTHLKYFIDNKKYYPLPDGNDLYTLSQVSKRHLYLPERVRLGFLSFFSHVPAFFKNFYYSLRHFILHDLHQEFLNHIHAQHSPRANTPQSPPQESIIENTPSNLHKALQKNGYLSNGQTLQEFAYEQINNSPYVVARANHPPSPPAYNNPAHRVLNVFKHFSTYFVNANERNPIVGTLATAAYFYGAGAVLAPKTLADLLTKLHLSGLIAGIEPTQKMAHAMCHGKVSESVSAAITYWQGIIIAGSLDEFFEDAVTVLKDDPAEVAIIIALALSLGYGLTKAIPALQEEMGSFPLPNYAALGAKGGAAIYDTIMHPGDDWLLGTCKWIARNVLTLGKVVLAPFFEWGFYGYKDGFLRGWKKSLHVSVSWTKQFVVACIDFILGLTTIPLMEMSAMLLHVPFRGITNFFAKTLATLGNIKAIGASLIYFAQVQSNKNFLNSFRLSPLYGFDSPLQSLGNSLWIKSSYFCWNVLFRLPWQLTKNVLILPLLDGLALTVRLLLTASNLLIWPLAYTTGRCLRVFGALWDNSIGPIFSASAYLITLSSNFIDQLAGVGKHMLLSKIQIIRGTLYYWAFVEEDQKLHIELNDLNYFKQEPMRLEKIPHNNSHCLLKTLLDEKKPTTPTPPQEEPIHSVFFGLSPNMRGDAERTHENILTPSP